jgi:hypothetical protein
MIHNKDTIKQENLVRLFKDADITSLDFFHNYVNEVMDDAHQLNDAGNALSKAGFVLHQNEGVLYSVEDSVRESIMGMDVTNSKFDETLWMGKSILFNYERTNDSWVMLQKVNKSTYIELARKYELRSVDVLSVLCLHKMFAEDEVAKKHENIIVWKIFKDKRAVFDSNYKESKFGWFAGDATFSDIREQYLSDLSMQADANSHFIWEGGDSEDDHVDRLHTIGCLEQAFKVLAFASVPMCKPQSISKNKKILKKLKRDGSPIPKSGGIFRVINLPHEISEQKNDNLYAKGGNKTYPNGRVPCLVYYKHERYTNKRYTWGIRIGIPDKNGNIPKPAYKVTLPSKGAVPLDTSTNLV